MNALDLVPELGGTVGGVGVPVAGGVVAGLLALVVVMCVVRRVWVRHRVPADRVVTLLAAGVALALSADGAYRLLTRGLGLPAWEAAVVAAVAELALIAEAVRAERSIRRVGHPGGHQYAIAGIALGAGFVVSTNAASLPEWLVRFLVPQLAALLWWMGAREDITTHRVDLASAAGPHRAGGREGTTWLVSPRRLAVQVGLIAATDGVDDLHALTRARRVRALARLLHRHSHTQSDTVRRWRARRVHRLAETADTATITAVADQLVRTRTVLSMAGLLTGPLDAAGPRAAVSPDRLSKTPNDPPTPLIDPPARAIDPPAPLDGPVLSDSDRAHSEVLTPGAARPEDVARARAAIAVGQLRAPITAAAIAAHLRIGRVYAAATRDALHQDAETPMHHDRSGAAAEPSGPNEHRSATAAGAPPAAQVEDQAPAQRAPQTHSVPALSSYTHA